MLSDVFSEYDVNINDLTDEELIELFEMLPRHEEPKEKADQKDINF
jgi:hypothetical protein